jgi:stage III sporulation protein AF
MLEAFKNWIINICTAIFFITAVEMILPSNSMKKYTKFVLGLILITVLINPIVKLFDKNFDIDSYVNTASKYFEEKQYKQDYDKYKNNNIDNTAQVFSNNLGKICIQKLQEKFPKDNYEVFPKVKYDSNEEKFIVDEIKVEVNEGRIKNIKKVDIKDTKEVNVKEVLNKEKNKEIIEYLSEVLNIPKDKIKVYKI